MEPQEMLAAFNVWKATHEALRGKLTIDEHRLVNECADFLVTVAQAQEPVYAPGTPYQADLEQSSL